MGLRIGGITFQGLASGFPTEDVIDQILELERRPIDLLEGRKSDFETKLSIFQDLNSKSTSLRNILRDIDNMSLLGGTQSAFEEFRQLQASSTNETIATASASGSAARGSLVFRVDQLAQQERELSNGYAAVTDSVGSGTFSIDIGGTGPVSVTIDPGEDTVQDLVNAINAADLGATAFIINDGGASPTPIRIAIVSEETGADQSMVIDASGLSGGTAPSFTETQTAQNAQITLDPGSAAELAIASDTNTFADLIGGLTIVAQKADPATNVTINVKRDDEAITERLEEFVSAYNEIVELVREQQQVDPTTNRGGPLIGDSTLNALTQRMASIFASAIGTGDVATARQLGLSLDRSGTLELDVDVLGDVLASDFEGVASFFSGPGSLSDQLRSVLDTYVDPVDGQILARINGINRSMSNIDDDILDAEDRLENIEANLVRQFAAMERIVSQLRQQGDFLTQFLNQQNNS